MFPEPDHQLSSVLRDVVPARPSPPTLRDAIAACWRGRYVIAGVALVGAAAGAAAGGMLPERYEAAATFRVAELSGRTVVYRTFSELLQSNTLAQDVIARNGLDK